jgi:hypothetical protein
MLLIVAALAACSDPAARVTLVPIGGACGHPEGASLVKVTAYATSGERSQSLGLNEAAAIAAFPADTEQLGVEVIVSGGETGAAGKSVPLAFNDLPDGATIPVLMAPLDGFCEVGALTEPRAQPLVARAGDGALVIGGRGAAGPLSTAEYFDPATATFAPVALPDGLADPQGVTGMALATLPDGRVALLGGPARALLVFDPASRSFTVGPLLIASRAFHAAVATGADEVIVAGGCFDVANGACSGVALHQVQRYHVDRTGPPDTAGLPATHDAFSARLFDLGVQLDGRRGLLLAGGTGAPASDRFALDTAPAVALDGGHSQAAALDGGAVLTAFADDAARPASVASVFPPEPPLDAAVAIAAPPALAGARLIGLEDGRVVAIGGSADGAVVTYDPTRNAWRSAVPASTPGPLTAPSLVRLADGAILVLGGQVSPRAWIYRPSLVGPSAGAVTAVPAGGSAPGVLTAPDPSAVTRGDGGWILSARGDELTARALVGGPRMQAGSVSAVVHVLAGGVALIAQQTGPGAALVAELAPGAPPRLVQLAAGTATPLCTATEPLNPADAVAVRLAITDAGATLTVGERDVLACAVARQARGAWGVAALGAGARVAVDSVTVAR